MLLIAVQSQGENKEGGAGVTLSHGLTAREFY